MKKMKAAAFKMATMVSSLALMTGVASAETMCMMWIHQPKMPQGMEKFRKK